MKDTFTIEIEFVEPKNNADRKRRRLLYVQSVVDCLQQRHAKKKAKKKANQKKE